MNDYKELIKKLRNEWTGSRYEAAAAIEQLVKERDAAIDDFRYHAIEECEICKHLKSEYEDHCKEIDYCCCECEKDCPCKACMKREQDYFEWRGVET